MVYGNLIIEFLHPLGWELSTIEKGSTSNLVYSFLDN